MEYSVRPSVLEVSWGSKKQSCLTDSTMTAEFVPLASCCKEAEWLRDLLINIPLWPKPMPQFFVIVIVNYTIKSLQSMYNELSQSLSQKDYQGMRAGWGGKTDAVETTKLEDGRRRGNFRWSGEMRGHEAAGSRVDIFGGQY
ncbi:hypothetical protein Tco_0497397 [Tanacetum coccineum]